MPILALLIAMWLLAACDSATQPSANCPDTMRYVITPSDTTVSVGSEFYATIRISDTMCPSRTSHDSYTWGSSDSSVVKLTALLDLFREDRGSRVLVTAKRAGSALLVPLGARYGRAPGAFITVR